MKKTELSLTFLSGRFRLQGTLHLPRAEKPPVVIGSHGLFSNAASAKQIALANECGKYGIAFFRFDHRGCGESEGNFKDVTSLAGRREDLLAAVKTILDREDIGTRIGLFGSSFGGAVCLSAAQELNAQAIVTVAAPIALDPSSAVIEIIKQTEPDAEQLIGDGKKLTFDISDNVREVSNLLLFHGDEDSVVPPSHALEIYRLANMPKRLIMFSKGDHPVSHPEDQKQFLAEASLWFKNSL
jgi:alpha-beta hydrolase superfamily lysophospholipase